MRFWLIMVFCFILPCSAFAGVLEEMHGEWQVNGEKSGIPADAAKNMSMRLDGKNLTLLSGDKATQELRYAYSKLSEKDGIVEIRANNQEKAEIILRLEKIGPKEMSIGEVKDKQLRGLIFFKR